MGVWLERKVHPQSGSATPQCLLGDGEGMSNLLQRMVQRTRSPLPGVEPVLPARYSRPATASQVWGTKESIESAEAEGLPSEILPMAQPKEVRAASVSVPSTFAEPVPQRDVLSTPRFLHEHSAQPTAVEISKGTQADESLRRTGNLGA